MQIFVKSFEGVHLYFSGEGMERTIVAADSFILWGGYCASRADQLPVSLVYRYGGGAAANDDKPAS